jgi:hypothetical protein
MQVAILRDASSPDVMGIDMAVVIGWDLRLPP